MCRMCRELRPNRRRIQDSIEDERLGILLTRVYVILLVTIITILTFYSLLTVHNVAMTVKEPSLAVFERLYNDYSFSLSCPCSQLAVPHDKIFVISPVQYHQTCQSVFIQSTWIDGYFTMNFPNASEKHVLPDSDFRVSGAYNLNNYGNFCLVPAIILSNAQNVFVKDQFISSETLSRNEFKARADSKIISFKTRTSNDNMILLLLMRVGLLASGTQNNMSYESSLVNGSWLNFRYSPAPPALNTCACSVAFECPSVSGQFLCIEGNECVPGTSSWAVPGWFRGCTRPDDMLLSDFHCFYNQSCVDTILAMYNVDMPDRLPLPPAVLATRALNSSVPSRFSLTDTLATILNQLMVEEWDIQGDFEGYYNTCAPVTCRYISIQRLSIISAVMSAIGYFGGLVVSLRLVIQMTARLKYLVTQYRNNRHRNRIQHEPSFDTSITNQTISFTVAAKEGLLKMNLFKKNMRVSEMENAEEIAIVSSRLYAILLTLSIVILMLFNGLTYTTVSVTVLSPTLSIYDELQTKYESSLVCSCKQVHISYAEFISIMVTYHQVCSSEFLSSTWITTVYGYGPNANSYLQYDRPLLSKQHQIIGSLCKVSQDVVNQAISNYNATTLINALVMSRNLFASHVNVSVHQLIKQTPLDFRRLLSATTAFMEVNLIPTAFNTDWLFEYGNASNDYVLRNIPIAYSNGTCNCVVSDECQAPLRVGDPNPVLPGLVVGCFPIDGLRMSTLECFYSSDCIYTILRYWQYKELPVKSNSFNFSFTEALPIIVNPLNKSTPSRFSPMTQIGTIIDELFIEKWEHVMSYETYYNICAPTLCNYKYSQRRDVLYIVTSLLSLYGGLTASLQFTVWYGMTLYKTLKSSRRTHHITVASQNNTNRN